MDDRDLPQPMRPHGFAGRIFGVVMQWLSAPNYRWVVQQLRADKTEDLSRDRLRHGQACRDGGEETSPAAPCRHRSVGIDGGDGAEEAAPFRAQARPRHPARRRRAARDAGRAVRRGRRHAFLPVLERSGDVARAHPCAALARRPAGARFAPAHLGQCHADGAQSHLEKRRRTRRHAEGARGGGISHRQRTKH